jgi:hypothetical protein
MFVCDFCGLTSKSGETSYSIVTRRRKVLYGLYDKNQNELGKKLGWEIIKESKACTQCNIAFLQSNKGE